MALLLRDCSGILGIYSHIFDHPLLNTGSLRDCEPHARDGQKLLALRHDDLGLCPKSLPRSRGVFCQYLSGLVHLIEKLR